MEPLPETERSGPGEGGDGRSGGGGSAGEPGAATTPIVRRIQADLKRRIGSGELGPGSRLPSLRQLSVDYGCSLGIVKQAVSTLAAQGHLRSSPRRGVFVAERLPAGRELALGVPSLAAGGAGSRVFSRLGELAGAVAGRGLRVTVHAAAGDAGEDEGEVEWLRSCLASPRVAGVVLVLPTPGCWAALGGWLRERGVPTAVVSASETGPGDAGWADTVRLDAAGAGRLAVERAAAAAAGGRVVLVHPEARGDGELLGVMDGVAAASAELSAGGSAGCVVVRPSEGESVSWRDAAAATRAALGRDPEIGVVLAYGAACALGAASAWRGVRGAAASGSFASGSFASGSFASVMGDGAASAVLPGCVEADVPLGRALAAAGRLVASRAEGTAGPAAVEVIGPDVHSDSEAGGVSRVGAALARG